MDGGCYCGDVRYHIKSDALFKGQCHCRECQTFSGGAPNLFMGVALDAFEYTKSEVKSFARADLEKPVLREFCPNCGTHLTSRPQGSSWVIVKIGTLDDPGNFEQAQMAIFTKDKQPFHIIPDGVPAFEGQPPRS